MSHSNIIITSCIVLYKNDQIKLKNAIDSCLQSSLITKLFLIDNSPTDDLKHFQFNSRVVYIHNPSNPGFGLYLKIEPPEICVRLSIPFLGTIAFPAKKPLL
jgi:hypothetical protein